MKVTRNWLKQYVDFDWSPEELAERLTMLGLEVEGVETVGGGFEGVVVAQVLTRDKHPNADKLSVCRVNDGQGERQIVCGAHNFKPGDKVPLILPGATLPPKQSGEKPFTIKVGQIRGVESHGMMCSHEELALDPERLGLKKEEGLLILPNDAPVGQPFAAYLGQAETDVVYDLETTPNRPDWNSVVGIAREIAAVTGNPLKLPEPTLDATRATRQVADLLSVRIEDSTLCPRYTARVIQGVKVGPSPGWLRTTLEKIGLRSINNVVDVTNYVMMETGQPLHAFDYHLLQGGPAVPVGEGRRDAGATIVIRRARDGEAFTTLDGQKHTLTPDNLLIADQQKGIALAGVMGGQNTEINDQTVDVLIESAYFNPANIRRTSKALGLRTDSSYRFERGADIGVCDWASRRAAQLILETAGGSLAEGVVDAYPQPAAPRHIALRPHKVTELLGVALTTEEIAYYLGQLGLKTPATKRRPTAVETESLNEPLSFEIPTFRVDLKREVDLIEEVCRLHGIDRIPATPPRGAHGANAFDTVYDQIAEARRLLTGLGLNEAQGQTLVGKSECRMQIEALVTLVNPLSADMDVLRPSLLPGLIHSLRHNVARKNGDVALFEIGRVFRTGGDKAPGTCEEQRRLAIALSGRRSGTFWSGPDRDAQMDASDLKGLLDEFLEQFGVRGVVYTRRTGPTELFLESAALSLGGKLPLGELGLVLPAVARQYDLRDPVLLAELDLDALLARRNPSKSFKPLPQFPSIRRDVAMLVPEATTHDDVLAVVRKTKPACLEAVELFDVFRGQNVPPGRKSLAYAFTYRSADKTLTDKEVGAEHDKLVQAFKEKLQAAVRE
ncbi:MAG: phenylalanine--tRNA ligase subunit beta [Verrucomicrobia bacterium]|jgi:phenylalanyl-tRNA synthetase beta chain|nr:phenylalanine--tRNA ligase subunit beta [Verrucomicrobiota bacterium]